MSKYSDKVKRRAEIAVAKEKFVAKAIWNFKARAEQKKQDAAAKDKQWRADVKKRIAKYNGKREELRTHRRRMKLADLTNPELIVWAHDIERTVSGRVAAVIEQLRTRLALAISDNETTTQVLLNMIPKGVKA